MARRIVDAACGPRTDSTIVDHEQRLVAADVAEWVIREQEAGSPPTPEEITRHAIATIIAEAVLVETAASTEAHDRGDMTESEVRDAAEALAGKANLSVEGATDSEFGAAIEAGLETLRKIAGGEGV